MSFSNTVPMYSCPINIIKAEGKTEGFQEEEHVIGPVNNTRNRNSSEKVYLETYRQQQGEGQMYELLGEPGFFLEVRKGQIQNPEKAEGSFVCGTLASQDADRIASMPQIKEEHVYQAKGQAWPQDMDRPS